MVTEFNSNDIVFTSDSHFDHQRIIEYCQRPFQNMDIMNARMLESFIEADEAGKTIFHMGDFTFGDKFLKNCGWRPKGDHYIILGNHDKRAGETGPLRKLYHEFFTYIIGTPVTWKINEYSIYVDDVDVILVLSHEPQKNHIPNWGGRSAINVYGHHHNNMHRNPELFTKDYDWLFGNENYRNVSVELTDYKTITYNEILNLQVPQKPTP